MKLEKINGNTYYINAPTNIGVYVFKNKNCILVDTGIDSTEARKIDDVLIQNNLHPKYIINTHSHFDHCGGNNYFTQKYTGCLVYASAKEKIFMENVEIGQSYMYSTFPVSHVMKGKKPSNVDYVVEYGVQKINDEKFDFKSLKGHSIEDIGVVTPDKVCFLGDSMFSSETIDKYGLPNVFNLENRIKSVESVDNIDADYFVIAHSDKVNSKDEIHMLIEKNIEAINNYISQILELLDTPQTRENILESLAILNEFKMNFKEYHIYFSSVCAFLTYLYNKGEITYSLENGNVYYYKVQK